MTGAVLLERADPDAEASVPLEREGLLPNERLPLAAARRALDKPPLSMRGEESTMVPAELPELARGKRTRGELVLLLPLLGRV